MSVTVKSLTEKRNQLMNEAASLLRTDGISAEQRTSADKMLADVDSMDAQIKGLGVVEAHEARQAEVQAAFERVARPAVGDPTGAIKTPEQEKRALSLAMQDYFMNGKREMSAENRALLTTSDTTGGAFIPQMFSGILIEAKKFYGEIATRVDQKVTNNKGVPMKVSFANDTANGLYLLATEGTSSPAELDPGVSSAISNVDTVSGGLVKVSFQELEDSSFDLDSFIRSRFAIRYARGLESIVTLGKDSAGTTLPASAAGGLVALASIAETTGTVAAGIGWTDLVTAFGALDAAYINPDTAWVMNTATRAYLLGLKDGFGRPYFTPDPVSGKAFAQLLGYDVVLDQAMPNMGINALPILFGDLKSSYYLRTDGEPSILRLNERFADQLEVGFYLYTRVGGLTKNAGVAPIVSIKQAAS